MHLPNTIELKAADHPVKAVTIFSSAGAGYGRGKAEVVRSFGIEMKVRLCYANFFLDFADVVSFRLVRTECTFMVSLATSTSILFACRAWMMASASLISFARSSIYITLQRMIRVRFCVVSGRREHCSTNSESKIGIHPLEAPSAEHGPVIGRSRPICFPNMRPPSKATRSHQR
jgi:hypothetical protein